jgi:branched-chain amino acid transport system substrate-binding protein
VDAIKAKKQDPSGAFVWTTYAALQSLQAGLNQSDDPAEIAKYLKAQRSIPLWGRCPGIRKAT